MTCGVRGEWAAELCGQGLPGGAQVNSVVVGNTQEGSTQGAGREDEPARGMQSEMSWAASGWKGVARDETQRVHGEDAERVIAEVCGKNVFAGVAWNGCLRM
jgi:hypothetical protein